MSKSFIEDYRSRLERYLKNAKDDVEALLDEQEEAKNVLPRSQYIDSTPVVRERLVYNLNQIEERLSQDLKQRHTISLCAKLLFCACILLSLPSEEGLTVKRFFHKPLSAIKESIRSALIKGNFSPYFVALGMTSTLAGIASAREKSRKRQLEKIRGLKDKVLRKRPLSTADLNVFDI